MTFVDGYQFSGCSSLASIALPESVQFIPFYMFAGCTNLASVTLGSNLKNVNEGAFDDCPNIVEINSLNPTPPVCYSDFMDEVYQNATLRVPVGSRSAYFRADVWINFDNIVETDFSGVEDAVMDDAVSAWATDGRVVIEGAANGAVVEIYNIGGQRIYRGHDTAVDGLEHGVYVVRVDGRAFKVVL